MKTIHCIQVLLLFLLNYKGLSATKVDGDRYYDIGSSIYSVSSIAATEQYYIATTTTAKTYRSADGSDWAEVAHGQVSPLDLVAFRDSIYGIADGNLTIFNVEAWTIIAPCQGRLKAQGNRLYNFKVVGDALKVRFTEDGATWTDLPVFEAFPTKVGNLYDLAADQDRVVVTGDLGRYLIFNSGVWEIKNIVGRDRLYSVLSSGNWLFFGGLDGNIYRVDRVGAVDVIPVGTSVRTLVKMGDLVIGLGGFNPLSGRVIYSVDGNQWRRLEGSSIPSVHSAAQKGLSMLFAGYSANVSYIGKLTYSPPPVSLLPLGDGRLCVEVIEGALGEYELEVSHDLSVWSANLSPQVRDSGTVRWTLEHSEQPIRFYRIQIK